MVSYKHIRYFHWLIHHYNCKSYTYKTAPSNNIFTNKFIGIFLLYFCWSWTMVKGILFYIHSKYGVIS